MAVLGSGAYSSVWIKSPYEQLTRVDKIRKIPDTDFDLLHLAEPAVVTRGVTPLDLPMFQPTSGPNHTCYAVGWSNDSGDRTENVHLRPDAKPCDNGHVCFTVLQKPRSCSVKKKKKKRVTIPLYIIVYVFIIVY